MKNPFYTSTYKLPEYFCDREEESLKLKNTLANGRNIVLLSQRRMGKTGLIKHVFYQLMQEKTSYVLYIDIMNTQNTDDFVNLLANSVLESLSSKTKKIYNHVFSFIKKLSPILSFDPQTGIPSVEFKAISEQQTQKTIVQILEYLENQNKPVYIAIDEFQQITNYREKTFEAFLRSNIQHLNNVKFIFSGSQQHLLTEMFNSVSRPFYQSADYLKLERIDKNIYAEFIKRKFTETKKEICKNDILEVLDYLDTYTFYVQNFFNKLWQNSNNKVSEEAIEALKGTIIDDHNFIYSNLHNLLTKAQYKVLRAIAKEQAVLQPTALEFIRKYNLGTASTVSSVIKVLIEKELLYYENETYKVYDLFMSKWLERN